MVGQPPPPPPPPPTSTNFLLSLSSKTRLRWPSPPLPSTTQAPPSLLLSGRARRPWPDLLRPALLRVRLAPLPQPLPWPPTRVRPCSPARVRCQPRAGAQGVSLALRMLSLATPSPIPPLPMPAQWGHSPGHAAVDSQPSHHGCDYRGWGGSTLSRLRTPAGDRGAPRLPSPPPSSLLELSTRQRGHVCGRQPSLGSASRIRPMP